MIDHAQSVFRVIRHRKGSRRKERPKITGSPALSPVPYAAIVLTGFWQVIAILKSKVIFLTKNKTQEEKIC